MALDPEHDALPAVYHEGVIEEIGEHTALI